MIRESGGTTADRFRAIRSTTCVIVGAAVFLVACTTSELSADGDQDRSPTSTEYRPPTNDPAEIPEPFNAGDPALKGLKFTEVAEEAGLTGTQSDLDLWGDDSMSSGVAVADVDGDRDQDIFLPRIGKPNALYLNDGRGNFTDVGQSAGVAGPTDRFGSIGGTFADFDGDGHMDLFVLGAGEGANELFINNGDGSFREEAAMRGLSWPPRQESSVAVPAQSATVADVNRDGSMDLLVLNWRDALVHGAPADQALKMKLGDDAESAFSGVPSCVRADVVAAAGYPVDDGGSRSKLYINDGTGVFHDATEEYELPLDEIVAFTGVFADLDGDGWQDLTVTGDFCTSRVFRNVSGTHFEDITEQSNTATDENGMGSVVRDVNGDGSPDWFVTSISFPTAGDRCSEERVSEIGCSGNRLFLNDGDMTFTDATDDFGLRDGGWGWGVAIEDFNNDGSLEFTMTNGFVSGPNVTEAGLPEFITNLYTTFTSDQTRFWVDDGDTYRDAAAAVGIDDTSLGHGLVAFDMDRDGDLDLLITPLGTVPILYRNDTAARHNWLSVALSDPTEPGNSWGDGARIEVLTDNGADPIVGWISTAGSYQSQKPPVFHVGLGNGVESVKIRIFWPGQTDPQLVSGVSPNQTIVVERGL